MRGSVGIGAVFQVQDVGEIILTDFDNALLCCGNSY